MRADPSNLSLHLQRPAGTMLRQLCTRTFALRRFQRLMLCRATSAVPAVEAASKLRTLEDLNWDHTFVRELPADPERSNQLRQVRDALFSFVSPTPTGNTPNLIAYSPEVCALLDLDPEECERPEFPLLMSGAAPLPGSTPYAQCYGGHQFGSWAGQLGDGRAITLGEVVNASGQRWELQLKGAGRTPYSRRADGRAVLRSSLREYVASEAMHHLGVPTTRALCLVGTGDAVARDMFYNGDVKMEPGAVVCRVSPSFVRFGTFQLPVSRGGGQEVLTRQLADYVIKHHFPELAEGPQKYLQLLQEVVERTGRLVAAWQTLGFVHGVLNTDNMSILGLTIDYGPYGFLDKFDPFWTPNLTDLQGRRYSYRSQPQAVQWNLVQLANALCAAELVEAEAAEEALKKYSEVLLEEYQARMAAKLGLPSYDKALTGELLQLMVDAEADWTNTWRALAEMPTSELEAQAQDRATSNEGTSSSSTPAPGGLPTSLVAAMPPGALEQNPDAVAAWQQWLRVWGAALNEEGLSEQQRQARQKAASPKYIPRQHLLQYAIEAAEDGDYSELETLMGILRRPYDDQPEVDPKYSSLPPEEMVRPGVCMLSCSS